jgi:hypothetical protein
LNVVCSYIIKSFKKKLKRVVGSPDTVHCSPTCMVIASNPLFQLVKQFLNRLIIRRVGRKKAITHPPKTKYEKEGHSGGQKTDRSVIMSRVSCEWWILALSKRITLLGPGNGFIRSSKPRMNCRKVMALNEPSTILACKTPSYEIAGKIEYLQQRHEYDIVFEYHQEPHRVPRSYALTTRALCPLYDHPKSRFMFLESTAASSTDTSWVGSYCETSSRNSARRRWSRCRAILDS